MLCVLAVCVASPQELASVSKPSCMTARWGQESWPPLSDVAQTSHPKSPPTVTSLVLYKFWKKYLHTFVKADITAFKNQAEIKEIGKCYHSKAKPNQTQTEISRPFKSIKYKIKENKKSLF